MGGDEAVEALPEMADGQRPERGGAAERQVDVDQIGLGRGLRQQLLPAAAGLPAYARRWVPRIDATQPGAVEGEVHRARIRLGVVRVVGEGPKQGPGGIVVGRHRRRRARCGSLLGHAASL